MGRRIEFIQIDEMDMKELRAHRVRVGNEELVGLGIDDRKRKRIDEGGVEL